MTNEDTPTVPDPVKQAIQRVRDHHKTSDTEERALTDHEREQGAYRAASKLFAVIGDPSTPEMVRTAITEQIAHDITTIIQQLDFSSRGVVCHLYPMVLRLYEVARFDPDAERE
jgi:hypothetical protein